MMIKKMSKKMKRGLALFMALFVGMGTFAGTDFTAHAEEAQAFAEPVDIYETFGDSPLLEESMVATIAEEDEDYRAWSQSDDRWGSIKLGSSSRTMKQSGCLVTSVAKLMVQCGLKSSDDFNPGVLVNWLSKNGGFTSGGGLYWAKPAEYEKAFKLHNYNLVSGGTYNVSAYQDKIIGWIKDGYHMVVAVQGQGHWVAIDEAKTLETGEIYIMDSLPTLSKNIDVKLTDRYGATFNRIAAYKGGTTPKPGAGGGEEDPVDPPTDPVDPPAGEHKRIGGATRYETSLKTADEFKAQLGVNKFSTVIITNGENYADALAGSYLAYVKEAPILMAREEKRAELQAYIKENVKAGGMIYVLGGTNAVPEKVVTGLGGYKIKRLEGVTRYETNIEILKEAGVTDQEILICTGTGFADSLSASASKKPILLVQDKLSTDQKEYLESVDSKAFYIIGGAVAVKEAVEEEVESYGPVTRLSGATRYETSVKVAETFVTEPKAVVLAYAENFPDGLCGGPLAVSMEAPLILTKNGKEANVVEYTKKYGVKKGIVLGGTTLISDETADKIFK